MCIIYLCPHWYCMVTYAYAEGGGRQRIWSGKHWARYPFTPHCYFQGKTFFSFHFFFFGEKLPIKEDFGLEIWYLDMQVLFMLGDITAGPAYRFAQWLELVRKRSSKYRASGFPRRPYRTESMPLRLFYVLMFLNPHSLCLILLIQCLCVYRGIVWMNMIKKGTSQ